MKFNNLYNSGLNLIAHLKLSGPVRSLTVKKNAYISFILMILSNIVQLLFVPVVIDCINPLRYGIWLTITSFLSWFNLMDLGIGGGLRTRLNKALAENDISRAKTLISSAYFSLFTIILFVFTIYYFIRPLINWERVFNAPAEMKQELDVIMLYVVLFFLLRFLFQLINPINVAHSRTAMATFNNFLGSMLALSLIYLLSKKANGSFFNVALIYSISPIIVFSIVTMVFFAYHRHLLPSISAFSYSALKSMLNLGFLILADQVSVIIFISSTNLLISHLTSPEQVTPYNVTMRLFTLFFTIYEIATKPLIPAFADAYFKGDIHWIKKVIRKVNYVTIAVVISIILSIFVVKPFIHIWLKGKVEVPWSIISLIAIFTIVKLLWNVYSKYLNGVGLIKETTILTICTTILYIPLVLLIGKFMHLGIVGLLIVQIVLSMGNVFYLPWLYSKSIKRREMDLASIL